MEREEKYKNEPYANEQLLGKIEKLEEQMISNKPW